MSWYNSELYLPTHDTGDRADALEADCRKIRAELERHRSLLEDSNKQRRDFEDSSRQVPSDYLRAGTAAAMGFLLFSEEEALLTQQCLSCSPLAIGSV